MLEESGIQKIYTVSELTRAIKDLLETEYPFIWIAGEISNANKSPAGHLYFTLKDQAAQIQAVMFRGQLRNLKFEPEDGLSVTGLGRISVYEPRGIYQILFEYLEPKGIGALQIALEQLKAKLADEGLFDPQHKKEIPFLPRKISIITSPTGAVVHDIIKVARRRFPNIHLEVVPAKVQGNESADEIVAALELVNRHHSSDIIIVARGGGSLEDLAPFNSERVARAIFASDIPVISAVGHETDFTIADLVADLRAPTPSAAAEIALPVKAELSARCAELNRDLKLAFFKYIKQLQNIIDQLSKRLINPHRRVADLRIRLDDLFARLWVAASNSIRRYREQLVWRHHQLQANSPMHRLQLDKAKLDQNRSTILKFMENYLNERKHSLTTLKARLAMLDPTAVLARGYSITRTVPEATVVRDATGVAPGQLLEIMLQKGTLHATVRDKS